MFPQILSGYDFIVFHPVDEGLLASAPLAFEPLILCCQGLCLVGCFTAYWASTNQMPVSPPYATGTIKNVSRYYQMSCGGQNLPWLRTAVDLAHSSIVRNASYSYFKRHCKEHHYTQRFFSFAVMVNYQFPNI